MDNSSLADRRFHILYEWRKRGKRDLECKNGAFGDTTFPGALDDRESKETPVGIYTRTGGKVYA